MSSPEKINPVKLFVGCIYSDENVLQNTKNLLEKKIGPFDFESDIYRLEDIASLRGQSSSLYDECQRFLTEREDLLIVLT